MKITKFVPPYELEIIEKDMAAGIAPSNTAQEFYQFYKCLCVKCRERRFRPFSISSHQHYFNGNEYKFITELEESMSRGYEPNSRKQYEYLQRRCHCRQCTKALEEEKRDVCFMVCRTVGADSNSGVVESSDFVSRLGRYGRLSDIEFIELMKKREVVKT